MRFTRDGRTLLYHGNPVHLAGVHAGTGTASTTDALIPPFADEFARLRDNNRRNNFYRHWLIPYWNYSPQTGVDAQQVVFQRNAQGKWRLFAFNETYWTRLEQLIVAAGQVGVVVQLVLFDRSGVGPSKPNEAPVRRWEDSPWNAANNVNGVIVQDPPASPASGLPEFYRNQATIRNAQRAYLEKAVTTTKRYWNVFYEIMNEPQGGSVDGSTADDRLDWADWVVGVVHGLTGGSVPIFYNDHTGGLRGADVKRWKQRGLPNYGNFHGVIFHGDPSDYDPANAAYAAFNTEKVFQVSSDGFPHSGTGTNPRDTKARNRTWTNHAFGKGMVFQAHTNSPLAADGIGAATIKPTQLV